MKTFAVEYRQDQDTGYWTATMPEVPAVVTQGKTLKEAYERVRNAFSLVSPSADRITLQGRTNWSDRKDLSDEVLRAVRAENDLRIGSLELNDKLEQATREAVIVLRRSKFSFRYAGQLLGITHQRVEQISKAVAESDSRKVALRFDTE